MGQEIVDRVEALGGAWGARRATMEQVAHALLEVAEVLAARDLPRFRVQAGYDEDLVTLLIVWEGEALPRASPRPDIADLEGPLAAQEAFALWLATRHALTVEGRGAELRLDFAA
jgi:hypothetical protein